MVQGKATVKECDSYCVKFSVEADGFMDEFTLNVGDRVDGSGYVNNAKVGMVFPVECETFSSGKTSGTNHLAVKAFTGPGAMFKTPRMDMPRSRAR